jgi:TonB-dependent SusC/RagA subfamily outer membrane receptor
MITILYYLLKVVLCSTILYTYYWFVLRNKQFHQYNRYYLMGISVLSWIVPFIKINIVKEQVFSAPKILYYADVIADKNSSLEKEIVLKSAQFTLDNVLLTIAIIISLLFIVRFLKSLWNIRKLIRNYPLKKVANLFLVMTDVKGTPFSFFKYIFWNVSIDINSEVGKKILAHEVAHIEENHSFDKLMIELHLVIGWFNPITWLIRNELYLIHEFIADQKAIQNNDTSILAELLLVSAYPAQQHILSNSFFFSPIKRRIQMFTKSKTTKFSYLRRLSILPILAATVLLFAFRNGTMNSRPIVKLEKQYTVIIDAGHGGQDPGASAADGTTEKDLALAIALKVKSLNNNPNINVILSRESDKFITVVDRANIANVSKADLFVSIHMDNDDTKKGTGATCYVPFKKNLYINESTVLAKNILSSTSELFPKSTLITTKDRGIWVIENANMPAVLFESGFISNPNDLKLVKANEEKIANMILGGINAYLANKEQSNTTSNLEKSNNIDVNQKFNQIKSLEVVNEGKGEIRGNLDTVVINNHPLYVLDGVPLKNLDGVSSNEIESMNILKEPSSLSLYGDAGKNGVIIITTKKGHVGNLQNKMNDVTVIGYGNINQEDNAEMVIFNAPKIQKNADPTKNNDPIFYTAEKPAEFPGGPKGWTNYLMNNLDRDLPVKNKAVTGKYTIKLNFLVNKDGGVENVVAENNPGYGTADEAIRVIEKGPKWIPAEQNGKKVNYLMKQVIVFNVAGK